MTKATDVFKLKNANNVEVTFIGRGGQIVGISVPDKNGKFDDVVIGYDTVEGALAGDGYFGALCGRFSNRIVQGKFSIDGEQFQLECNDNKNHLHGGFDGFSNRVWEVVPHEDSRFAQTYKLSLVSPDGDQGYPGELKVEVVYGLTDENELVIEYVAETSKPTIINLTSHAYFNLKGASTGSVEGHQLQMNASKYNPLSAELGTVSGEIAEVKDTPMDFIDGKTIGEAVNLTDEQITMVNGIDHNFIIDGYDGMLRLAARLSDEESGRCMEVFTDQPGIQIYTGGHFDSSDMGKDNTPIVKWAGVAMETQNFPDAPNNAHFPNSVLRPGETYKHTCVYKFSV